MNIITNVNETQKAAPINVEQKLDIKPQEIKIVKKVEAQQEIQKFNQSQPQFQQYNQSDLQRAVEETNRLIFKDNGRFEFKIHERTNRLMVKLVDKDTDEVLKEIPPEKILDLVASIWDLVGILVDERG